MASYSKDLDHAVCNEFLESMDHLCFPHCWEKACPSIKDSGLERGNPLESGILKTGMSSFYGMD